MNEGKNITIYSRTQGYLRYCRNIETNLKFDWQLVRYSAEKCLKSSERRKAKKNAESLSVSQDHQKVVF